TGQVESDAVALRHQTHRRQRGHCEEQLHYGRPFSHSARMLTSGYSPFVSMEQPKILAVLEDLFFMVKINESAKRAGVAVEFVKSEQDVLDKVKDRPPMIILDLNFGGLDPLKLVTTLKSDPATKPIRIIAYLSHVQGELKQQAQQAGCDMVLARSAFSQ